MNWRPGREKLLARAHRKGTSHEDASKQRRQALILVVTGLARVAVWATLLCMYIVHLLFPEAFSFTTALFTSVAFVSCISLYANGATDFGQVAASLAMLTAGDVHHAVAEGQTTTKLDVITIEKDIEELAKLQPCKEADELAAKIREQIVVQSSS